MEKLYIERVIANKIADHWYKNIHGQIAPIFGKQKLRDFTEAELKKLHIPHVVGRSEQFKCEHKGRRTATELVEYCEDCKKILYHP